MMNGRQARAKRREGLMQIFFQRRSTSERDRYSILNSFANHEADAESFVVTARRLSKFLLETFSVLQSGILGMFMEKSASTATADHHLWTQIANTGNDAPEEVQKSAGETQFTSSKKLLLETLGSARFRWIARRQTELDVCKG